MESLINREFLISILDEIPFGVAIMAVDGTMLYYNRTGEELSKLRTPDTPPETWIKKYGIFHENGVDEYRPEEMPIVLGLAGQTVVDKPMILRNVDSEDVLLWVSGKPVYDKNRKIVASVATFQNKTNEMKIRNQLDSARKLESIGRLAGGVAHDFNNMLGTVLMAANHCLDSLPKDHACREELNMILEVSEKSAALIRQLLAFGRKQIMQPKHINVSEILQNSFKMIGRFVGSNIELKLIQGTMDATTVIDPVQFEQVVLNLCANARDAMPTGGKIIIETNVVEIDEKYRKSHAVGKTGKHVLVMVSDTGQGIPKANLHKIFDPFFSSKDNGYGLGLATVQGIVEQSGGFIWVYSEEGQGTTFKVYFPYLEMKEGDKAVQENEPITLDGTEVILLVEDDKTLRTNIGKCLSARGYNVFYASSGEEALRVMNSQLSKVDLLLTDVIMPGMNGRELATKIKETDPALKVLYTSGYSENVIVHNGILKDGIQFLQKPASENELLKKVRFVLDKT